MTWDYKSLKPNSRADRDKLAREGYERYKSDAKGDHYRRRKPEAKPTATKEKTDE